MFLSQGLGRDAFSVLQGTIRDVYRELKMVAATEKEDTVLAHVSLAIEEIDNIVKSLFIPDNGIEKKKNLFRRVLLHNSTKSNSRKSRRFLRQ